MKVSAVKNINYHKFSFNSALEDKTLIEQSVWGEKDLYLFATALGFIAIASILSPSKITSQLTNKTPFRERLASALSVDLGRKISSQDLRAVMTKEEFLKEIPLLNPQNYIKNSENIKSGTFLADLHSHSNFSDGQIKVEDLLAQATEYGNYLNKLNGKKFIFALSDHDGVEGTKEALRLIAKNPEKYENIKFIPASEISFQVKCYPNSPRYDIAHNLTESSEMLTYFINPFSNNSKRFFSDLYSKRDAGVKETIAYAKKIIPNCDFSEAEYNTLFYNNPWQQNPHWRLHDYIQVKNRINNLAKQINQNPEELYKNLVAELISEKHGRNPYGLDCLLKEKGIGWQTERIDENIAKLLKSNTFPFLKDGEAFSKYDCNLEDIIEYAHQEDLLLGFAHPAFTIHNFNPNTVVQDLKNIINKSNGRIICAEKYHQAYPIPHKISQVEVDRANRIVEELNLINIGGCDNHSKKFVEIK